jgi:DNA-binding CsgD family transcriptional regulator
MGSEGRPGRRSAAASGHTPPPGGIKTRRRRTDRFASRPEPGERERAALATLDKFSRGVFLLDLDGTVTFANRAAESMVARDDGLLLRRHRLQFRCATSQAAFEHFLTEDSGPSGESLVLCTQEQFQGCAYRVLVSTLEDGTGYCVFLYEPNGGHRQLPISVLRRLYRLTPAEAHLTNELFAGKTLAQAARARGISINTAKYTLKSIFSKCEVSSRAELLLLLSLGPRTP